MEMTSKGIEPASEAARFALRMGLAVLDVESFVRDQGEGRSTMNQVFVTLETIRAKIRQATSNEEELTALEKRCSYFTACVIAVGRSTPSKVDVLPLAELVADVEDMAVECGQRWCFCIVIKAAEDKQKIEELHSRLGGLVKRMGLEGVLTERGKIQDIQELLAPPDFETCAEPCAVGPSSYEMTRAQQPHEATSCNRDTETPPHRRGWAGQPASGVDQADEALLSSLRRMIRLAQKSLHPSGIPGDESPGRKASERWKRDRAGDEAQQRLLEAEEQLDFAVRSTVGDYFGQSQVVESLRHLAKLLESQDWGRAKHLYLRALAIDDARQGPCCPGIAETLYYLGQGCQRAGKQAESEQAFTRSLRILEENYGPGHEEVGYALEALGSCLLEQGRAEEGEALLQQALETLEGFETLRARFVVLRLRDQLGSWGSRQA